MSPFTCLSFPNLQQMRNENVHCILEFPIHIQILSFICWKTQVVSEGTAVLKRSSTLSYAQHPAYVNLNHNIDLLSFLLMIPPKAVCVSVC